MPHVWEEERTVYVFTGSHRAHLTKRAAYVAAALAIVRGRPCRPALPPPAPVAPCDRARCDGETPCDRHLDAQHGAAVVLRLARWLARMDRREAAETTLRVIARRQGETRGGNYGVWARAVAERRGGQTAFVVSFHVGDRQAPTSEYGRLEVSVPARHLQRTGKALERVEDRLAAEVDRLADGLMQRTFPRHASNPSK